MKRLSDLRFRPPSQDDVRGLNALQAECYPPEVLDDDAVVMALALPRSVVAVRPSDGRILGAAYAKELDEGVLELYSIEVAPELRGQGLAGELTWRFLGQAWGAGTKLCRARAFSTGGHAVLRQAGFVETGSTEPLATRDGGTMRLRVLELRRPSLHDRMKAYEECQGPVLDPDLPYAIRVDGKAFHTWTRGLDRPFDNRFIAIMDRAAENLAETVQDAALAYVQSDEVTVLVPARSTAAAEPWFGGALQKVVSVSASVAAATVSTMSGWCFDGRAKLASFDGRAFNLPCADEAFNCLVWRQRDAMRNAVSAAGQALFSHRELHGKSTEEIKAMIGRVWKDASPDVRELMALQGAEGGYDWDRVEPGRRQGRWVTRRPRPGPNGSVRHAWHCEPAPVFEQERTRVMALLDPGACTTGAG